MRNSLLAANLQAWAALLVALDLRDLTLVPHHAMGAAKRAWLGLAPAPPRPAATPADIAPARDLLSAHGVTAHDPGEEPW